MAEAAIISGETVFGWRVITSSTLKCDKSRVALRAKSPSVTMPSSIPASLTTPTQPKCLAAIRAEQIRIAAEPDHLAACHVCFAAQVLDSIFEGERIVYEVTIPDLGGEMLRLFDHDPLAHNQFPIGDKVYIGWNNNDMQLFPHNEDKGD